MAKVKFTGEKPANQISCVETPRRYEIEFREYLPQLDSEFCLRFLFKNSLTKLWNSILSVASSCYETWSFTFRYNISWRCWRTETRWRYLSLNPLNPELNPICYLLALLAQHFLHVSRIRVKSLTLRLLMSIYIYGAPILDVSRSHTTTQHIR